MIIHGVLHLKNAPILHMVKLSLEMDQILIQPTGFPANRLTPIIFFLKSLFHNFCHHPVVGYKR
jgi:hypothetical protein